MKYKISACIVMYKNDIDMLRRCIQSFLNTKINVYLFLIDNSPNDDLKCLADDSRIQYLHNPANLGFGAGHNIVMNDPSKLGKYHVVLNPDIYFENDVLEKLTNYMDQNPDVGNVMPKILYPNGDNQFLCKLLPTPMDFFGRMFLKSFSYIQKRKEKFELRFWDYKTKQNIPYLSGCFMFLRSSVISEVGCFDDRIFMYVEDTDLSRRIYVKYKNMYNPDVTIYHEFGKGSHKSFKLLCYSIKGAYVYFNKFGWFFDKQRRQINKKVLKEFMV